MRRLRQAALASLCAGLCVLGPSPAAAADPAALTRLLQRGDAAYASQQLWPAVGFYREALRLDGQSYEALWRLARAFVGLAAIAPDKAHKAEAGKQAFAYGERAIALRPGGVEGQYWTALGIGDYGSTLGYLAAWREGIRDKFLRHLEAARRADPRYEGGGPDRVFGLYYHRLPWPMKDVAKALAHLRRAARLDPNNIITLYYLGAISAEQRQPDAAQRVLRRCASRDPRLGDRLYAERYRARCTRLLEELGR